MQEIKRYQMYVNNVCSDILSKGDYIPCIGEKFTHQYTTGGQLRTDVVKVVGIEEESYISKASRFLPQTKHTIVKIMCEVVENKHKQRFSAY